MDVGVKHFTGHVIVPDIVKPAPDFVTEMELTGTSIMAVQIADGVVIGADSRTSMGNYVADRVADKLTKVTDHIYCCRSGAAAHTQAVADIVAYHLDFNQKEMGEPPTVELAANIFKELCYNHRDELSAGIICAGWDKRNGGSVYSITMGGMLKKETVAIGGSGSSYMYGYVDSNFKEGMGKEEATKFVTNSLALAMSRDSSSGGVIRLGVITKDGIERTVLSGDDIPKFYKQI